MYVDSLLKNKGGDTFNVSPETSVGDSARLLAQHRIGAVLVMGAGGKIAGILSERDVVRGLAQHGAEVLGKPVSLLMTADVITCRPSDTVNDIMKTMSTRRIRHLPVTEQGKLVGIISIGDVVKRRLEELEKEADSLREYVAGGY